MRKMSDIVRGQNPLTLPPRATVREACRHRGERDVGAVLVREGDRRLAGIFTGRDADAIGRGHARDPKTPPGRTAMTLLVIPAIYVVLRDEGRPRGKPPGMGKPRRVPRLLSRRPSQPRRAPSEE